MIKCLACGFGHRTPEEVSECHRPAAPKLDLKELRLQVNSFASDDCAFEITIGEMRALLDRLEEAEAALDATIEGSHQPEGYRWYSWEPDNYRAKPDICGKGYFYDCPNCGAVFCVMCNGEDGFCSEGCRVQFLGEHDIGGEDDNG